MTTSRGDWNVQITRIELWSRHLSSLCLNLPEDEHSRERPAGSERTGPMHSSGGNISSVSESLEIPPFPFRCRSKDATLCCATSMPALSLSSLARDRWILAWRSASLCLPRLERELDRLQHARRDPTYTAINVRSLCRK